MHFLKKSNTDNIEKKYREQINERRYDTVIIKNSSTNQFDCCYELHNDFVTKSFLDAINSATNNELHALLEKYGNNFRQKPTDSAIANNIYLIQTPLQLAIINKKIQAVKIILKYLEYSLTTDQINYVAMVTELCYDIADTAILTEILKCKGANPNKIGGTKLQVPLYYAILNKCLASIDILLATEIDFDITKFNSGLSAIEFCILNRYPDEIVSKLLNHKNIVLSKSDLDVIFVSASPTVITQVLTSDIKSSVVDFDFNQTYNSLINRQDIGIDILMLMQQFVDDDYFNIHLNNLLTDAITKSNVNAVEYLLQKTSIDLTIIDSYGKNALTTALLSASDEIVKLLLNHININCSVDNKIKIINQRTSSYQTPILIISEKNNTDLFKLFYKLFQTEINFDSKIGYKLLYDTIKNSNSEIFDLAIKHFPINTTDSGGMTLAMHAVRLNKLPFVKKLITDINFNINITDVLGRNILIYLLEHKYNINESDYNFDSNSIKITDGVQSHQSYHCVNSLTPIPTLELRAGFDSDCYAAAAPKKSVDMSDRLMGFDLGIPAGFSSFLGTPIASTDNAFDINFYSALTDNKKNETAGLIQFVLNKKVNCNLSDSIDNNPLIYTIKNLDYEMFSVITKSESFDPNFKLADGKTYAMFLINKISASYNAQYIIYLLDLLQLPKFNINATDYLNNTLLMYVCRLEKLNLLQHIIQCKNIDLEATNYQGETSLMITLKFNPKINWSKVKTLITHGAVFEFNELKTELTTENFFIFENIIRG